MDKAEVIELLKRRWPPERWIMLTELPTRTGFAGYSTETDALNPLAALRRIDAFAISLWPSDGYKRVAFEIKLARSDWLREQQNPLKMVSAFHLSSTFWFVLGPGVFDAEKDRLRQPWGRYACGLLEIKETKAGLRLYTRWKPRDRWPWPMPDPFVAALLRKVRDETRADAENHWMGKLQEARARIAELERRKKRRERWF